MKHTVEFEWDDQNGTRKIDLMAVSYMLQDGNGNFVGQGWKLLAPQQMKFWKQMEGASERVPSQPRPEAYPYLDTLGE